MWDGLPMDEPGFSHATPAQTRGPGSDPRDVLRSASAAV